MTPFQTRSAILGPPGGHCGFWFSVAGGAALEAGSEFSLREVSEVMLDRLG